MDGLLRLLGYTEGTVKVRYEELIDDSQPTDDIDPRPILLAKYDQIMRDAEQRADWPGCCHLDHLRCYLELLPSWLDILNSPSHRPLRFRHYESTRRFIW